jgi:hypothetical protein
MSAARLTVHIDGREALPVRAIPYTNWRRFPPDAVARLLAHADYLAQDKSTNLTAYHISDGIPVAMLPHEWDTTVIEIEGYVAELEQVKDEAIADAMWRKGAPGKLYAGAFVWVDELKAVLARRCEIVKLLDARQGDDELTLMPKLDEPTHTMIREGFEPCKPQAVSNPHDATALSAIAQAEELPHHERIDAHAVVQVGAGEMVSGEADSATGGGKSRPEWIRQAWAIGEEWMIAEEKRVGERPSVVSIAKHVACEFKRLDIRSKRLNDYYDWQTIRKEALTGITGRKPGENFKKTMGNPQRRKPSPNVKGQ